MLRRLATACAVLVATQGFGPAPPESPTLGPEPLVRVASECSADPFGDRVAPPVEPEPRLTDPPNDEGPLPRSGSSQAVLPRPESQGPSTSRAHSFATPAPASRAEPAWAPLEDLEDTVGMYAGWECYLPGRGGPAPGGSASTGYRAELIRDLERKLLEAREKFTVPEFRARFDEEVLRPFRAIKTQLEIW